MKRFILKMTLLLILFLSVANIYAQQEVLAKFYVTHATNNGVDITEWAVKSKIFTVFYISENQLYMANYSDRDNSQSWGRTWGLKNETIPESSTNYRTDVFSFNWNYRNSYDSKTGSCKVQLLKIYKPQGIVSVLKLITESLDITEYTGYMEGSIDFSNF